ncbi:MAG: BrnT family toxin [Alphaproteobacteria bacterium]|nr:BrnT family toxin [Alphaproteobacteria bacterium]
MEFEWDAAKERANRRKHGVGFRIAARVFLDPYALAFDDQADFDELRFNAIGMASRL